MRTAPYTPELLYKALSAACAQSGVTEFDYSVEMWGILWTPTYVYVNGERIDLEISSDDLSPLVRLGMLEETKVYSVLPNEPLEIFRSTYRLMPCRCGEDLPRRVETRKDLRCL